jgi:hypothetical protein
MKDGLHLQEVLLKKVFKLLGTPLQLKHLPSTSMIMFGSGHLQVNYESDQIIVSGHSHLLALFSSFKPVVFPKVEQLEHLLVIFAKPSSQ